MLVIRLFLHGSCDHALVWRWLPKTAGVVDNCRRAVPSGTIHLVAGLRSFMRSHDQDGNPVTSYGVVIYRCYRLLDLGRWPPISEHEHRSMIEFVSFPVY